MYSKARLKTILKQREIIRKENYVYQAVYIYVI